MDNADAFRRNRRSVAAHLPFTMVFNGDYARPCAWIFTGINATGATESTYERQWVSDDIGGVYSRPLVGILHETTLAYSPHQNGKMECFWGQIEGRLMAMLERQKEVSLAELNRMTHAWVEMDYHYQTHSETTQAVHEHPVGFQKAGWQAILDNFKKYVEKL